MSWRSYSAGAYFLLDTVSRALPVSIAAALAALLIFGGVKGQLTDRRRATPSASRTAVAGTLAAAAAFAIARLVGR